MPHLVTTIRWVSPKATTILHHPKSPCPSRDSIGEMGKEKRIKNLLNVVTPKALPCLYGCLIYLVISWACSLVVYSHSNNVQHSPIAHCPFVLLSFDALTFLCSSSEHQQGTHFRKLHLSSTMTPSGMLYFHTHTLLWMKRLTLCLNWAKIYVTEECCFPSLSHHPYLVNSLLDSRESTVNTLSSILICLKWRGRWLAKPGRREVQQGSKQ